ncbi:hypothetical protein [Bradyrhizobium elkanii]|nr:hypothetical protein [Bradyrhizobium elkanii]
MADETHHNELAAINALFGTPYVEISKGPKAEEIVRERRRPDGS